MQTLKDNFAIIATIAVVIVLAAGAISISHSACLAHLSAY